MANTDEEQYSQQPIELDCAKAKHDLLNIDLLQSDPTRDYDTFITRFRAIAKHPTRQTFTVPQLPLENEVYKQDLPQINNKTDPESDDELKTLSRGGGGRGRLEARAWRRRGSERGGGRGRSSNLIESKEHLRAFLIVSMNYEEKTILFLYDRVNVYMKASRDIKNRWWEFSVEGDKLFPGSLPLGFNESYQGMDTDSKTPVVVGRYQFEQAFQVFCDPSEFGKNERKKASQIMIALTSESGRMIILSDKFSKTLTDDGGTLVEKLSDKIRLLMQNWSKVSHILIDNSELKEKSIGEIMSKVNRDLKDLIEALKEGGMELLGDASLAYGLLLAKSQNV